MKSMSSLINIFFSNVELTEGEPCHFRNNKDRTLLTLILNILIKADYSLGIRRLVFTCQSHTVIINVIYRKEKSEKRIKKRIVRQSVNRQRN